MLCSNCYKKIPEGEEVAKSGKNYFKASWHSGYGTEIYCKKRAEKKDRFDRTFLIIFFSIWVFVVLPCKKLISVFKLTFYYSIQLKCPF
jgi:hypothetical protein